MVVQKFSVCHAVLRSILTDPTVLTGNRTILHGLSCLAPGLINADIQKHDTTVMDKSVLVYVCERGKISRAGQLYLGMALLVYSMH